MGCLFHILYTIALFTGSTAYAQAIVQDYSLGADVSWKRPTTRTNGAPIPISDSPEEDFEFVLHYTMVPDDIPCSEVEHLNYSVKVGGVTSWSFIDDPHFQPGRKYKISVQAIHLRETSEMTLREIEKKQTSAMSNGLCLRLPPDPKQEPEDEPEDGQIKAEEHDESKERQEAIAINRVTTANQPSDSNDKTSSDKKSGSEKNERQGFRPSADSSVAASTTKSSDKGHSGQESKLWQLPETEKSQPFRPVETNSPSRHLDDEYSGFSDANEGLRPSTVSVAMHFSQDTHENPHKNFKRVQHKENASESFASRASETPASATAESSQVESHLESASDFQSAPEDSSSSNDIEPESEPEPEPSADPWAIGFAASGLVLATLNSLVLMRRKP